MFAFEGTSLILAVTSWLALIYLFMEVFKSNIYEVWIVSLSILVLGSFLTLLVLDFRALFFIKILLILGAVALYFYKNQHKKQFPSKKTFFTALLFIAAPLLIVQHESYSYVFNWDDFSHWARSVTLLVLDNGFGEFYFRHSMFDYYGPASSVWHAYFQDSNSVNISVLYLSQIFWILASFMCIYGVSAIYTTNYLQKVLVLIVLAGLANTLTPYGHNLQVDILIGLGLASTYMLYNYSKHSANRRIVDSSIVLFTIVLSKPIGFAAALQFAFINLLTKGATKQEIIRNIAIVLLSSLGILLWLLYIPENNPSTKSSSLFGEGFLQRIVWQLGIFYDFFVAKIFHHGVLEKSHIVIYGGLFYSLVVSISNKSAKLFKIVFFSIVFYLIFLLFAYVIFFNGNGSNAGEALSLGSINRYFSVQFYFLVPVMLVETMKLHRQEKNDFALILLVILVASYFFTKLFFLFVILAAFIIIFPWTIPRKFLKKIFIFLTPLVVVAFYYSYGIIEKKLIPSDEYMTNAKRLKEVGRRLRGYDGDKTIVVWDNFNTYHRLATEYYSDYQYRNYEIINTEEYKSRVTSGKRLSSDAKVIFFNKNLD